MKGNWLIGYLINWVWGFLRSAAVSPNFQLTNQLILISISEAWFVFEHRVGQSLLVNTYWNTVVTVFGTTNRCVFSDSFVFICADLWYLWQLFLPRPVLMKNILCGYPPVKRGYEIGSLEMDWWFIWNWWSRGNYSTNCPILLHR